MLQGQAAREHHLPAPFELWMRETTGFTEEVYREPQEEKISLEQCHGQLYQRPWQSLNILYQHSIQPPLSPLSYHNGLRVRSGMTDQVEIHVGCC